MKVLQYAACINSFAAWKAITEEEPGVDLMTPRMFGQRTEAEAWMRSQKHPEYFTIVPAVSIREAAYTGANYPRRPIPPQAFNFARHDLGTPTPLVDWADAKGTCSARFFLADREFEVITRRLDHFDLESEDHPEKRITEWLSSVFDSIYALFPNVTVEMLIAVYGSYQLHMEIERRVESPSAFSWMPRPHKLTMRRRELIADLIEQFLNQEVDRLALLLPPDFLMLPSAGSYNPATLSELRPEYTTDVEAGNEGLELVVSGPVHPVEQGTGDDRGKPDGNVTRASSGKNRVTRGRKPKFTEDELKTVVELKAQEPRPTWRTILGRLRPGSGNDTHLAKQLKESFRYFQKVRSREPVISKSLK